MPIPARTARAIAAGALAISMAPAAGAQKSSQPFALTVGRSMRGPKLVGYPQTGLRWSGDSSRLYFEWRRPGDDEAATWVVGRDGSNLRKLDDDQRRQAPPAGGQWDRAHRRVVFADEGDIVL